MRLRLGALEQLDGHGSVLQEHRPSAQEQLDASGSVLVHHHHGVHERLDAEPSNYIRPVPFWRTTITTREHMGDSTTKPVDRSSLRHWNHWMHLVVCCSYTGQAHWSNWAPLVLCWIGLTQWLSLPLTHTSSTIMIAVVAPVNSWGSLIVLERLHDRNFKQQQKTETSDCHRRVENVFPNSQIALGEPGRPHTLNIPSSSPTNPKASHTRDHHEIKAPLTLVAVLQV